MTMSPKLLLLLILQLSSGRTEDSPLADMASAFLQNLSEGGGGSEGLAALGSLVGTFMQGENANNIGSMLSQGQGADMLSGLGSLLTNQDGQIDPSMVGSMLSMFTQNLAQESQGSSRQNDDIDLGGLLSAAGTLFQGQNAAGFLPLIMNTLSSFTGAQAEERAHQHHDHAAFLPPIFEKFHIYWDHFLNSELGRALWKQSGLQSVLKSFQGQDGKLDLEKLLKGLENHSFRRKWIKHAAQYLTEYAVHLAKPEVQERYLTSAQYLVNGVLQSQGFPKQVMFDPARAAESASALANYVARKYLNMDVDLSVYVTPAFQKVQQILKMAQTTGRTLLTQTDHSALSERVTDTLNLDVIEPVLRVYRAYRHSLSSPQCRRHLMCLVNRPDSRQQGLPGFKAGLTKLSSLVASAALSYHSGEGFWDLYNAVQNDVNCEAKYPADCSAFHEHEEKVTTEYFHNEL